MYKKFLVLTMALLMVFTLSNGVFADDNDMFNVGNVTIDQEGELGYRIQNELMTTNDTVTAAESGKTFIVDTASTQAQFKLPAAAAGLEYTFIGADTVAFLVVPNGTDTITLLTLSAGDSIASSGAVGDAITLTATTTGTWYASVDGGTFVDSNSAGD